MDARGRTGVRGALTALVMLVAVLAVAHTSTPLAAVSEDKPEPRPTGTVERPAQHVDVARVCDATARGPSSPPAGAVAVDPAVDGDLSDKTQANPPGTTFWLRPGRHTLGDDEFGQVIPKDGNTYLGAPGAVLDGKKRNFFAFTQGASDVTVRYLTITRFVAPHNQGVVNHDSGDGWVIEHNTIENNSGAAMMAGKGQKIRGNCLRDNGQYGINAYKQGNTITDLLVEGNEIVGNNTDDWERKLEGCGCTGGLKLWAVDGADLRNNWIHDNRGPGLWADVNNNDILIEDNLIEENDSAAIIYETSYNAIIRDNVMRRNNWVEGREFSDSGDPFPSSAIYISESGGEPRIPARTDKIDIHGNLLEDNWSGITAWENADRFCNSPANPSGDCTRLVSKASRCAQPGIARGTLYADCRWKTQRVSVHDNRFVVDPTAVPGCRRSETCGRMALLSNYGTYPTWSPYDGAAVQQAITFDQDNRWYRNTYVGPWTFMVFEQSRELSVAKWRAKPYRQDTGSRFR